MSGDLGWISFTFWDMGTQLFAMSPKFNSQTFKTGSPACEVESGGYNHLCKSWTYSLALLLPQKPLEAAWVCWNMGKDQHLR